HYRDKYMYISIRRGGRELPFRPEREMSDAQGAGEVHPNGGWCCHGSLRRPCRHLFRGSGILPGQVNFYSPAISLISATSIPCVSNHHSGLLSEWRSRSRRYLPRSRFWRSVSSLKKG